MIIVVGCHARKKDKEPEVKKQILQSLDPVKINTIIQKEKDNKNLVILDVRTPSEYARGHIKNAILIDYHSMKFKHDLEGLDRNKIYVLYCQSGFRSKKSLYLMGDLGFKTIYEMSGGFVAWYRNKLPVVK